MKVPKIFVPKRDLKDVMDELVVQRKWSEKRIGNVKEFYGSNVDKMPLLVAEGRVPLSVSDLMRKRLEVLDSGDQELVSYWRGNYFDTGDAVIYHPNGNIKVVLDAEPMKKINPKSELKTGALVMPDGMYDKLDGETFTRKGVEKYSIVGKLLSKEEAKKNPIWKALAHGDQALLNAYVDATFKKAEEYHDYDKNMKIWLSQPQEVTTGRLWCVDRLDYNSNAYGSNYLGNNNGRLVGVAPEAH